MLAVNLDATKVMKSELLHKLMARRMVKMVGNIAFNSVSNRGVHCTNNDRHK